MDRQDPSREPLPSRLIDVAIKSPALLDSVTDLSEDVRRAKRLKYLDMEPMEGVNALPEIEGQSLRYPYPRDAKYRVFNDIPKSITNLQPEFDPGRNLDVYKWFSSKLNPTEGRFAFLKPIRSDTYIDDISNKTFLFLYHRNLQSPLLGRIYAFFDPRELYTLLKEGVPVIGVYRLKPVREMTGHLVSFMIQPGRLGETTLFIFESYDTRLLFEGRSEEDKDKWSKDLETFILECIPTPPLPLKRTIVTEFIDTRLQSGPNCAWCALSVLYYLTKLSGLDLRTCTGEEIESKVVNPMLALRQEDIEPTVMGVSGSGKGQKGCGCEKGCECEYEGSGMFDTLKEGAKKLYEINSLNDPLFKIKKQLSAKDVFKGIAQVTSSLVPLEYSPQAKAFLDKYGTTQITTIKVRRAPIAKGLDNAFELISGGHWEEGKSAGGYDAMFHLSLIANDNLLFEKLSKIHLESPPDVVPHSEFYPVEVTYPLTVNEMLEKTRASLGDEKYFKYDPFTNNCQQFVRRMLKVNDLLTPQLESWVVQPVEEILAKNPDWLPDFSQTLTNVGALLGFGVATRNGIHRRLSDRYKGRERDRSRSRERYR
jgi:hypothetical protein